MSSAKVTVIIPAAGIGKRMGFETPKQYALIGRTTVLEHTIKKFLNVSVVDEVLVGISTDDDVFPTLNFSSKVRAFEGGAERADTVLAGLSQVDDQATVLVHDAARPFVSHADIMRLINHAEDKSIAAILATHPSETVKYTKPNLTTLDRDQIWLAQTPQCANAGRLRLALEHAKRHNIKVTDEASALEFMGERIDCLLGDRANIKLTDPFDWVMGQVIAKEQGLL